MKKLLGIVVLGLLLSSSAYANDIILKCSHSSNGTKSLIINEENNKIILDGYRVKTPIKWGTKIYFMSPDPNVYTSQHSHNKEVSLDRITGKLIAPNFPNDRVLTPFFQCIKVKALF